jgi:hypothetical protein
LIEYGCLLDSLVKCNMSFCSSVAIETIGERLLPGRPVALAIVAWYQAGQGAGVIGAIVGAIIILVVWGSSCLVSSGRRTYICQD